ncbi:hypothetical protein [Thermomonas sp.]|uniref:hypothetical protein n=1 Tax=Thermomonas sp. TaxID=1971895 RepID=UPI00248954F9|nr:hypothetical protein [Thermomonas sp.]MDI1253846.1 hypothetical protein [Thermomonas sp.]
MKHSVDRSIALIGNGRLILVGASLFLYLLNHEGHYQALKADLFPIEDHSTSFARHDDTMYTIHNYEPLVQQLRANPEFNLEYHGLLIQTIFMNVGDELSRNGYFDHSPQLEFFRHVRNAMGHGNSFHFLGNEPTRPAILNGRELTASLHGQKVLFDYLGPGDVLDLLDQVEHHLISLR